MSHLFKCIFDSLNLLDTNISKKIKEDGRIKKSLLERALCKKWSFPLRISSVNAAFFVPWRKYAAWKTTNSLVNLSFMTMLAAPPWLPTSFKASCSDVCFSVANFVRLTSIFGEFVYMRDGTRQKSGSGW